MVFVVILSFIYLFFLSSENTLNKLIRWWLVGEPGAGTKICKKQRNQINYFYKELILEAVRRCGRPSGRKTSGNFTAKSNLAAWPNAVTSLV